jgi:hypothetical protein
MTAGLPASHCPFSIFQYFSFKSAVGSPGFQPAGQSLSERNAFRTRKVSSTLRPTLLWLTTM